VIFPQTSQIESIETNEEKSSEFLASRKVKTIGLLDNLSVSKMFVRKTQDELKDEIAAHTQSYKDPLSSENAITDGFVFDGADNRHFGYTETLLPHTKSQIAARFSTFLKSGGAIVSVQSRILPMTCLALHAEETSAPIRAERSVLFCEITDTHAIHVWVAVNCENKIFSPLVSSPPVGMLSARYLIDSVCAQTEKQYHMRNPSLAVLIDGSENDESHDIRNLLSEACGGNILEMGKNLSRYASLYGAVLGGERL
jgi:hypothetical protein